MSIGNLTSVGKQEQGGGGTGTIYNVWINTFIQGYGDLEFNFYSSVNIANVSDLLGYIKTRLNMRLYVNGTTSTSNTQLTFVKYLSCTASATASNEINFNYIYFKPSNTLQAFNANTNEPIVIRCQEV